MDVTKQLPLPKLKGSLALEQAIKRRRTIRAYADTALDLAHLTQLLWAAQGITEDRGFKRAAASAGALYPMDLYAVAGDETVAGLQAGLYHYDVPKHIITQITPGDLRNALANAALYQSWMARAPLQLVITAEYNRITGKYGERGVRYAMIEAGHMGQNIFLQAEALSLGAGIVGAFRDDEVTRTLKLPRSHAPLLIMPVGYRTG